MIKTRRAYKTQSVGTFFENDPTGLAGRIAFAQKLLAAWEKAVGAAWAAKAQPLRIEGETLIIGVNDPIWIQEISFMTRDICRRLMEHLPELNLTKIRCEYVAPGPKAQPPKRG